MDIIGRKEGFSMIERILPYDERENLKRVAWEAFHKSENEFGKASALLGVIEAHYWREREYLDFDRYKRKHLKMAVQKKYFPGYELDIDHYTLHWLHSMRHLVPKEVLFALKKQWGYEPVQSKYLPDGCTSYQWPEKENKE